MPEQIMAAIIENEPLGGDLWCLELLAPELVRAARPGQFVQVRVSAQLDPLLRRPLSIFDADAAAGVLRLLYKTVGRGTHLLTRAAAGETLDVMGPLGNGFALSGACACSGAAGAAVIDGRGIDGERENKCRAVLVGGGVGCAPLWFLARTLLAQGCAVEFCAGAATGAGLSFAPQLAAPGLRLHLATEDGSQGRQGRVTELFADIALAGHTERVYCCGPEPMMAAVAEICRRHDLKAQFSLEQHMACGVGACLGCACRLRPEDEGYAKICKDGPVFDLEQLGWGREGRKG